MKTYFTVFSAILLVISQGILSPLSAQWIPYEIDADAGDVRALMTADMDGDGDQDITATDYTEGYILWYENDNFAWNKHYIETDYAGPVIAYPADIDNDDTLDVVVQGNLNNKVAWYENNHPTWTEHIIDSSLGGAEFLDIADLDDDGDLDVVAAGYFADAVVWYENNNLTWIKHTIDNSLNAATTVAIADIDGDGTLDVVATGSEADDVVWYENNHPIWNKNTIDADLDRAWMVGVADIDGDDDIDVAVAGIYASVVNWYENNDLTWNKHTIDDNLLDAAGLVIAHIDNDDKPDILANTYSGSVLKWYKNNLPTWEEKIIDTNIQGLGVGDLDGDNFIDVISGAGTLKWYNNKLTVAHAKSVNCNPTFIPSGGDTLIINAQLYNPENHPVDVHAIITCEQNVFTDSIQLFDDGQHDDSLASDHIWGNSKLMVGLTEDTYRIGVSTYDIPEDYPTYLPPTNPRFTSIGPIVFSPYVISSSDTIPIPGAILKYRFNLLNKGLTATANDISAFITLLDTCASFSQFLPVYITNPKFGDIEPGEVVSSLSDQIIKFSETCTGGHDVKFAMEIFSNDYHFWSDTFSIPVVTSISHDPSRRPNYFSLSQNYPNPFNPSTVISYQLPVISDVDLSIYNLLGQKVAAPVNEKQQAGSYQVEWDATNMASGIYYYRLVAGEFSEVRKMILIR